jgi:hypothetical protein
MQAKENRYKKGTKKFTTLFIKNLRLITFVIISVVMLWLYGCETAFQGYSGDRLPPNKVATVSGYSSEFLLGGCTVYILDIDGKEDRVSESEIKLLKRVEILPGEHTLTAIMKCHDEMTPFLTSYTETSSKTISFNVEAGHSYEVGGEIRLRQFYLWVEDRQSKELVGGSKP